MPRILHLASAATLALALGWVGPGVVCADDAPGAPAPDSEQAAARAEAAKLNLKAVELFAKGKYADATALAREVLAMREKALGKDDPDVATSLNNLAGFLQTQGAYAEARPLYDRAIAICEKARGRDDVACAPSLSNLANLLKAEGAYAEARPLYERALAIYENVRGNDHPDVAGALEKLAALRKAQGAYAEARILCERGVAILEKAFGKDDPRAVTTLNNLGEILQAQGAYGEARTLFERSLAIREHALGREHPVVAPALNNLALLLMAEGAYGDARPLLERGLAICEKAFGKEHVKVAASLNSLAELLRTQGSYDEARPLYERALAINEKALGKDHPYVAVILNNLAAMLQAERAYAKARTLCERALAIREKALGMSHPDVAASLHNLAVVRKELGDYTEAKALEARALTIQEGALGTDHPDVAKTLGNWAGVLEAQGLYAEARPLYERSLAIRESVLGPNHPDVATALSNLAGLLAAAKAYGEASPLYERSLEITQAQVRSQFSALTARQRVGLLRSTRYRLDNWVRFAPRVGLSGYPEVLRLRGLVARTEAAERLLARHADRDDQRALETLAAARRRAARLANEIPSSFKTEVRAAWQQAYAEANAERERLTVELTRKMAPLRAAHERLGLGLKDIEARLGPDTALVDFLRVGDRYFAWVVRSTGEPIRTDVGAADEIEKASSAFVLAITQDQDVPTAGAALRALAWAPVAAALGDGVKRVVICPDAALAAVPFSALPGLAPDAFLLDDLGISYVMDAADLVPWADAPPIGAGALLVGDVDYDHASVGTNELPSSERPVALAAADRAPRGGVFVPLPQTGVEVEGLRDRFGRDVTTLLRGAEATEARLRAAVRGKRFVHVATHGFAREDLLAGLYTRKIEEAFTSADAERQLAVGHDPMLLSGLAMAGANPRDGTAGDDGILTALEASYLDLDGVDVVTLSACETAKGTAESGEGVQGLVSALEMAGAHRVLASLWRVDDEGTQRLMDGTYVRMLRPGNPLVPADALREAARSLRDSKDASGKARFAAPRYWSAFVCYERK